MSVLGCLRIRWWDLRRRRVTRVRSISPDFRLPRGKRHAFLVVLGFSRVLWLQFFVRQTMREVLEGLETAFIFFGGVPRELLFDQMKAVIIRDKRGEAVG